MNFFDFKKMKSKNLYCLYYLEKLIFYLILIRKNLFTKLSISEFDV